MERVFGLMTIRKTMTTSWGYDTFDTRFTKGRCDWSKVTSVDDLTLPTCDFSDNAYCWGHASNDTLEFTNFLGNGETYTNLEFLKFINPLNDSLPYLYDTYTFDYCSDHGIDFDY